MAETVSDPDPNDPLNAGRGIEVYSPVALPASLQGGIGKGQIGDFEAKAVETYSELMGALALFP